MEPFQPKPPSGHRPYVIAHRGISGKAPENTLAAFRLACATPGIDMIELTKTPPESYVMRTVGLSLIVVAIGLMVLYLVKWRARWNEVLKTGLTSFGLRRKK